MPELISILLIGLWAACTAPRLTYCELCGADTDNGEPCHHCAAVAEGVAA